MILLSPNGDCSRSISFYFTRLSIDMGCPRRTVTVTTTSLAIHFYWFALGWSLCLWWIFVVFRFWYFGSIGSMLLSSWIRHTEENSNEKRTFCVFDSFRFHKISFFFDFLPIKFTELRRGHTKRKTHIAQCDLNERCFRSLDGSNRLLTFQSTENRVPRMIRALRMVRKHKFKISFTSSETSSEDTRRFWFALNLSLCSDCSVSNAQEQQLKWRRIMVNKHQERLVKLRHLIFHAQLNERMATMRQLRRGGICEKLLQRCWVAERDIVVRNCSPHTSWALGTTAVITWRCHLPVLLLALSSSRHTKLKWRRECVNNVATRRCSQLLTMQRLPAAGEKWWSQTPFRALVTFQSSAVSIHRMHLESIAVEHNQTSYWNWSRRTMTNGTHSFIAFFSENVLYGI